MARKSGPRITVGSGTQRVLDSGVPRPAGLLAADRPPLDAKPATGHPRVAGGHSRRASKTVAQLDAFGAPKRYRRTATTEHAEQVALMNWLAWTHPSLYAHAAAVPNGGHRHINVARRMRAEGVRPGYPDILVDLPRGAYHGLRIEMKTTGSTWCAVSPEQRIWLERLRAAGYRAEPAYGLDHAQRIIDEYAALESA
jgi:hypothetical protein